MNLASLGKNFLLAILTLCIAPLAHASLTPAEVLSKYDTDHDGALNWKEVQTGAIAEFKRIDYDNDQVIDIKEWKTAGLSDSEWKKANPKKGLLIQTQFVAWMKQKFDDADTDHDDALNTAELSSPKAKTLMTVLK